MALRQRIQDHWGWVVLACGASNLLIGYGILNFFVLTFVELKNEFNSSASAVAWIGSLSWFIFSVFSPLMTKLCKLYSNKKVAFVGVVTASLALAGSTFVSSTWLLYISYGFLFAFACSTFHAPVYGLVAAHFVHRFSVLTMGLLSCTNPLSLFAIVPLSSLALEAIGWRWTYRIMAAALLIVGLPCTLTYQTPPQNCSNGEGSSPKHGYPAYSKEESSEVADEERSPEAIPLQNLSLHSLSDDSKLSSSQNDEIISQSTQRLTGKLPPSGLPNNDEISTRALVDRVEEDPTEIKVEGHTGMGVTDSSTVASDRKLEIMPAFWLYILGTLCSVISGTFNVISMGNFLVQQGLTAKEATVKISIFGGCDMAGRFTMAIIGDRLPIRPILFEANLCFVGAMMALAVGLSPSMRMITAYVIVGGFVRGAVMALEIPAALSGLQRPGSSYIVSAMLTAFGCGALLAAACSDLPFDLTGSYTVSHFICAVMWIFAALSYGSIPLFPCLLREIKCRCKMLTSSVKP